MPGYGKNKNKPYVNYLSRDFLNIKEDLMKYAKAYFPNSYNDFNETSPGMMLLEMNAYVGDVLNFYIDQQFKELFLPTVEERPNLINLAKTLGYKAKAISPALVEVTLTQTVGVTGTPPNVSPDMSHALVLEKGIALQSDFGDASFETINVVDFNITGSNEQSSDTGPYTPEVFETNASTGVATSYKLKTKAIAVSGFSKEQRFTIGEPKAFLRLTIPDKDVVNILSVKDSNGNNWYEVDYLAQDKIYDEVHWSGQGGDRDSAYLQEIGGDATEEIAIPVPSKLNGMTTVSRRFVTEVNHDNTTSLVFGNGLNKGLDDTTFLEEEFNNASEVNAFIQGGLPASLAPSISYGSLGDAPSNTTLIVTYRVGGGIKSNVPANSINTIVSRTLINSPGDGGVANGSLSATNEKPASGGHDGEDVGMIRENAKANFTTQNRVVTKEDYESRILSMPSRFGSVAKVFAKRKSGHFGEGITDVFDFDPNTNPGIDSGDTSAFTTMISDIAATGIDGSDGTGDGIDYTERIQSITDWIASMEGNNLETFKNIDLYVLSYDNNKNLMQTPNIIKDNIVQYLSQFKVISDDVTLHNGYVVNFGVKFEVVARANTNKSELKVKCIQEIKNYFDINNMHFNQTIFTSEIENILYNIDGVKYVKNLKITQDANDLNVSAHLHSSGGTPNNGTAGVGSNNYGFAYNFNNFYGEHTTHGDGVILPVHPDTPTVFELKNPLDNIKGVVE